MFSEALKMMDDNMYHYMADQYQAKVEKQQAEIENQQVEIENQQAEIENLQTESQKLYQALIERWKKDGCTKESAISEIAVICKSEDTAKKLIEKYW